MGKPLQKNALLNELVRETGLSKEAVKNVLAKLADLAYREAINGFVIPGICKLKVVKRKASRCRNPVTGQLLLVGERNILKVSPLKKAKDMIAPRPVNLVQVVDAVSSNPSSSTPSVERSPAALPEKSQGQVIFNCSKCGNVVAAAPQHAGMTGECPFCSAKIAIPSRESDAWVATNRGGESLESDSSTPEMPQPDALPPTDFITFVCQVCGQEIEAPIDMMGMEAACPACASPLHVPKSTEIAAAEKPERNPTFTPLPEVNRSSMTIRIDLSDLKK